MLRNNKKDFIVFKKTFVWAIHRKFFKQRFTSAKDAMFCKNWYQIEMGFRFFILKCM